VIEGVDVAGVLVHVVVERFVEMRATEDTVQLETAHVVF
jgi:hypothetical protein|tara:strand:- start:229 stop:345 length:117 start_codon:yes stop_codon:yes gene_type:complete